MEIIATAESILLRVTKIAAHSVQRRNQVKPANQAQRLIKNS